MRRTASQVLRQLEMRVARLERSASNRIAGGDWKQNSIHVYHEEGNGPWQRNWICTTDPNGVKAALRRIGQGYQEWKKDGVTCFELDTWDDWQDGTNDLIWSMPSDRVNAIMYQNPTDARTFEEVKRLLGV